VLKRIFGPESQVGEDGNECLMKQTLKRVEIKENEMARTCSAYGVMTH
jgi:hypothetical protein